jgi:hypothetical protein
MRFPNILYIHSPVFACSRTGNVKESDKKDGEKAECVVFLFEYISDKSKTGA